MKKRAIQKKGAIRKRLISLVLIMALLSVFYQMPRESVKAGVMPGNGKCGKDATFKISTDMTLTIDGKGAADEIDLNDDYNYENVSRIKKVIVNEGITEIGSDFFYKFKKMTEITLPQTLTKIGNEAFSFCESLKEITIPDNVTSAEHIFRCNYDLRKVVNNSKTDIDLNWRSSGLTWDINGVKDTILPAGKTAIASANTYPIKYKISDSNISGKKVTSYTYGTASVNLPAAKKKGYIFTGWYKSGMWIQRTLSRQFGQVNLYPNFITMSVKNKKSQKIVMKVTSKYEYPFGFDLYIRFADNKSMKNAKEFLCNSYDKLPKNITYKYNIKKDTITFKKLKKKKTYYIQAGYYDGDYGLDDGKYPVFVTKKIKITK